MVAALFALASLACKNTSGETAGKASASTESKQRVAIAVDGKGFTPSSITLKKGQPATLVFTRTTNDTCAREVVFPEINLKKDLPLNTATEVDVPTGEARTLGFQCGMAMLKGSVVIAQ